MFLYEEPLYEQPQEQADATTSVRLDGLWIPGQAEATGRHGIPVLGPAVGVNISAGIAGRRWHNAGSQTNSYVELLANSSALPTSACTIIVIGRQLAVNNGGIGIDTTIAAEKCGISIANTASQIDWDFGGNVSGSTRLRSAALTNLSDRDVWACTTGPRGMEVWRNGVLIASNAATPTRSASTARWGIGLNLTSAWSATANEPFAYYGVALSSAQMSAAFLAQLVSPEAVFSELTQPRSVYTPVEAASAPFKPAWAISSNAVIGAGAIA